MKHSLQFVLPGFLHARKTMLHLRILFFLLICSCKIFAQQDTVIRVNDLRSKDYYTEHDFFYRPDKLEQIIRYDEPGAVDEDFTYHLFFGFLVTDSLRENRVFDLEKDTGLVYCSFNVKSPWSWFAGSGNHISGTIKVVRKTRTEVVLLENIRVSDGTAPDLVYTGERTFRKKKYREKGTPW